VIDLNENSTATIRIGKQSDQRRRRSVHQQNLRRELRHKHGDGDRWATAATSSVAVIQPAGCRGESDIE